MSSKVSGIFAIHLDVIILFLKLRVCGEHLLEPAMLLHKFTLERGIHRGYILVHVSAFNHALECINIEYLLNLGIQAVISYQVRFGDYLSHQPLHHLLGLLLIK